MRAICVPFVCLLGLAAAEAPEPREPVFRVNVQLAEFTFSAADKNGSYITGLRPDQVTVFEDGKEQEIVSFCETRTNARQGMYGAVFVLVDTSNHMYEKLPAAFDAIADFVRSIPPPYGVAVYGFSRNLHRIAPLSADRDEVVRNMRKCGSGDETALFDAVLLTLRDAAKLGVPERLSSSRTGRTMQAGWRRCTFYASRKKPELASTSSRSRTGIRIGRASRSRSAARPEDAQPSQPIGGNNLPSSQRSPARS